MWSEPAPPVSGSRLDGLNGAAIFKMPPFFGVSCCAASEPGRAPASTTPAAVFNRSRRLTPASEARLRTRGKSEFGIGVSPQARVFRPLQCGGS